MSYNYQYINVKEVLDEKPIEDNIEILHISKWNPDLKDIINNLKPQNLINILNNSPASLKYIFVDFDYYRLKLLPNNFYDLLKLPFGCRFIIIRNMGGHDKGKMSDVYLEFNESYFRPFDNKRIDFKSKVNNGSKSFRYYLMDCANILNAVKKY